MTVPPPPPPPPSESHHEKNDIPALPPPSHSNPIVVTIVWVVVIACLAVGGLFAWRYYKASQNTSAKTARPQRPIPVDVATATLGDMPIYVESVGSASPFYSVTVHTRIDGQLDKVAFTEGQLVHEGDLLVQIDPRPYQVQLAQAQAQLAQAQAQLTQANGQLVKDVAARDNAQLDVNRYNAAKEAVAQQTIDTAKTTLDTDQGAVEVDKGAIASANAAIKTAQAGIDAAQLNLVYCTITAPITGIISLRAVDPGNLVHASDANGMAIINQLQPITVLFSPNEDDLPNIQKALAENPHLPVDAWDRNHQQRLAGGTVAALDNQIDPTTATFRIKAVFPNENNALFPNQFVNIDLLRETLHDVVLVPNAAIQLSPTSKFVYLVKPDNSVEMHVVTTGDANDTLTVVTSNLASGDTVVTSGVDKLQPGSKVTPHKPGESTTTRSSTQSSTTSAPASQSGRKKGSKGPGS